MSLCSWRDPRPALPCWRTPRARRGQPGPAAAVARMIRGRRGQAAAVRVECAKHDGRLARQASRPRSLGRASATRPGAGLRGADQPAPRQREPGGLRARRLLLRQRELLGEANALASSSPAPHRAAAPFRRRGCAPGSSSLSATSRFCPRRSTRHVRVVAVDPFATVGEHREPRGQRREVSARPLARAMKYIGRA